MFTEEQGYYITYRFMQISSDKHYMSRLTTNQVHIKSWNIYNTDILAIYNDVCCVSWHDKSNQSFNQQRLLA
jgi:hypothetical protein